MAVDAPRDFSIWKLNSDQNRSVGLCPVLWYDLITAWDIFPVRNKTWCSGRDTCWGFTTRWVHTQLSREAGCGQGGSEKPLSMFVVTSS